MTILFALLLALTPAQRARDLAHQLPFAKNAMLEVRRNAAAIRDPALRAAVETQLLAPWLPPETWAFGHLQEAAQRLHDAKLLEGDLVLPPPHVGDFSAAPGGPCEDGHHGYPGGLGVHTLANVLHARALAQVYEHVYGVKLNDDVLTAAAIWHDSLKAATLPFHEDGSCGPEGKIAGTPAHHILGLVSARLRHLSAEQLYVIASAHTPPTPQNVPTICNWLRAAAIIADGQDIQCPAKPPLEAFVNHFSDADFPMTVTTWTEYARGAPRGWARYEAMVHDGNDLAFFSRSP